ncbi:MAG TPA: N-acetyltransferase [Patescibacteria group bacterium]|nr:N-acetyltransferase [Patescibacteria group bacterium]
MNIISKNAKIGQNVKIGNFTTIHDNVEIGDNCVIEDNCILGYPTKLAKENKLIIGSDSYIRSHSIFYEGSKFGRKLVTGHGVLVRENTHAGSHLQIGTNADIEGDCIIGNYVKMHTEVHIAKDSVIGDFVWFFPRVQFTNDPFPPSNICEGITIKDMAVIATNSLLLPGITIGMGSFVAAASVVRSNVPDIYCVAGDPARIFARVDKFFSVKHGLRYPWAQYFKSIYPEESLLNLENCLDIIRKKISQDREINFKENNLT